MACLRELVSIVSNGARQISVLIAVRWVPSLGQKLKSMSESDHLQIITGYRNWSVLYRTSHPRKGCDSNRFDANPDGCTLHRRSIAINMWRSLEVHLLHLAT